MLRASGFTICQNTRGEYFLTNNYCTGKGKSASHPHPVIIYFSQIDSVLGMHVF